MSTRLQIRIKKLVDPELDLKLDYGERISSFYNHKITQIFTRNFSLKRKALLKELICFSFSTGFLFVKKKKCLIENFTIHFNIKSGVAYVEK